MFHRAGLTLTRFTIYGTLVIIREGAASEFPESVPGLTAKFDPKEKEKLEADVKTMGRLKSEAPDFADGFIILRRRYGAYFGHRNGRYIEPQSHRSGVGYGSCFFHVHPANAPCHLGH